MTFDSPQFVYCWWTFGPFLVYNRECCQKHSHGRHCWTCLLGIYLAGHTVCLCSVLVNGYPKWFIICYPKCLFKWFPNAIVPICTSSLSIRQFQLFLTFNTEFFVFWTLVILGYIKGYHIHLISLSLWNWNFPGFEIELQHVYGKAHPYLLSLMSFHTHTYTHNHVTTI